MKDWKAFEKIVARLATDEYDDSYTIIPNARIYGHISKRKRQIDVLIEHRYNCDLSKRIIIDAKKRKQAVDINDVEAFEGLMRDVGAKRGYLVCTNGYSKSALRRAEDHITIKLISENEIETFSICNWDECRDANCKNGLVLWDSTPGIIVEGTVSIQSAGKCDECGKFHVWCWGCGSKKVLDDEDEWQCSCEGPWFWLTSIEEDEDAEGYRGKGKYLLLIMASLQFEVIDRRPL